MVIAPAMVRVSSGVILHVSLAPNTPCMLLVIYDVAEYYAVTFDPDDRNSSPIIDSII